MKFLLRMNLLQKYKKNLYFLLYTFFLKPANSFAVWYVLIEEKSKKFTKIQGEKQKQIVETTSVVYLDFPHVVTALLYSISCCFHAECYLQIWAVCPSWKSYSWDVLQEGGKLYIFLELVTQGSLAALYQKYHLQDSQVSAYTRQILNGLLYLHQRNVLHRWVRRIRMLFDCLL